MYCSGLGSDIKKPWSISSIRYEPSSVIINSSSTFATELILFASDGTKWLLFPVARLLIIESLFALLIVSPQSNPPVCTMAVVAPLPLLPCWFTTSIVSAFKKGPVSLSVDDVSIFPVLCQLVFLVDTGCELAKVCSIVIFFLCCLVSPS